MFSPFFLFTSAGFILLVPHRHQQLGRFFGFFPNFARLLMLF